MSDLEPLLRALAISRSLDEISEHFSRMLEPREIYAFTLGSAPLRKGKIDSSGTALHSTLPTPFQDDYHERQMAQVDPIFEIMASRFMPFTRSSARLIMDVTPHKAAINDLADEHDIGEALMIPINTADFARGVALLTKLPPNEFAKVVEQEGPLLHMAALAVMHRAVELGFGQSTPEGVRLTDRERDCLELCAQGRTNDQIALALGISERTVRFHLSNCYEKLDAKGSSHAITRALQLGLIRT